MPVKVSVCMITYNHEQFIAQAIESIMMQQTTFDFELVIGEDCSTDYTRHILLDYQARYPDKIRLLLPEKNLGMMNNFITTLKACEGEYVALCEGDDYWINQNKLQSQVDFLDNHHDYSISFHQTIIKNEINGEEKLSNPTTTEVYSLEKLLLSNFICTASCLFRNGLIDYYPDFFYKTGSGDWVLHILNASKGKIGYMDEPMAVYRIHTGGTIFNANTSLEKLRASFQKDVFTFESLDKFFNYKYHHIIKKNLSLCFKHIALIDIKTNSRKEAIANTFKSIKLSFNLINALYLLPLALSPNPHKLFTLVSAIRGK